MKVWILFVSKVPVLLQTNIIPIWNIFIQVCYNSDYLWPLNMQEMIDSAQSVINCTRFAILMGVCVCVMLFRYISIFSNLQMPGCQTLIVTSVTYHVEGSRLAIFCFVKRKYCTTCIFALCWYLNIGLCSILLCKLAQIWYFPDTRSVWFNF